MIFWDPEHWTIRGGPEAKKFGDDYTQSTQAQVQHDRSLYLYNVVGELSIKDAIEVIREARRLGKIYGWKKIIWERRRKDGSTHKVYIPIIGNSEGIRKES